MSFNCFANILVHHPYILLIGVAVFSGTCLIIPFTLKSLPNFSDPQMGFETRGTSISNRITSWKNLVEATKESGPLTVNPREFITRSNISNFFKVKKKQNRRKNKKDTMYAQPKIFVESNVTDPHENNWRDLMRLMKETDSTKKFDHYFNRLNKIGFFCGPPNEDYAHIVLKSNQGSDLFTLESLLALCRIERELIQAKHYKELCVRTAPRKPNECCRPWSLANYVALLQNRSSCLAITGEDVRATKDLLRSCSRFYHSLALTSDCADKDKCSVPRECMEHNAVFNIFNFLTSTSFLPPNKPSDVILEETIIFIPLACSTAILPYYHELKIFELDYEDVSVVAMEFGIKNALFDECLVKDIWLVSLGGLFVMICMWIYTGSLFLTIMTIIAIVLSLGISYFMYTLVFELRFFPFMNVLTAVVAVGIGADDAFIFCKVWHMMKIRDDSPIGKVMSDTLHHALVSMSVTSFTTTAAFFASYISSVTAIRCFSVFASISILVNCLLMITWFPACIVVWEKFPSRYYGFVKSCISAFMQRWCCASPWKFSMACYLKFTSLEKIWNERENIIVEAIIKFRLFWFILLSILAFASAIVVFYYPGLQLPNSTEFQLFDSSHVFEKYDLVYRNLFWFARAERSEASMNYKLPLRFVWGIELQDDGNYLEPQSLGTLRFDESFNMSHPDSQMWLLEFCRRVRVQPFYQSTLQPLLPNCYIEIFKSWMDRRCNDTVYMRDRSPCCESEPFPFRSWVFDMCIIDAIGDLYETPPIFFTPGIEGPMFSKDGNSTIKTVVVEFDSNYSYSMSYEYMHNFVSQVENWFNAEIKTAPLSMRGGWFVSDLEFYDLQRILSQATLIAIVLSMVLAWIVLLLTTLNLVTSLYAVFNITCSIIVTMAILVLLGWKLNILESIAMSTAIGLTVDFSIHYTVNYRLAPCTILGDRKAATRYALTNMLKPVTMAALTTGMAGAFMMPSLILAYIQIGVFLVTVMSVSWLYATFHLGSLLALGGPENNFGQCSYSQLLCYRSRRSKSSDNISRDKPATSSISDTHELYSLTNNSINDKPSCSRSLQRSLSGNKRTFNKYVFPDQSPSATSAITIIMPEDN